MKKGSLAPNLKLTVPPPDDIPKFKRSWTESGKFKDGDLLVNCDGVRIVSHSEVEAVRRRLLFLEPSLTTPSDNQLSLADFDAVKVIGNGNGGVVRLVRHKWTGQFFALKEEEICQSNGLHVSIVVHYLSNLSTICVFHKLSSFRLLKEMLVVPRLNKFHETENRIDKSHLLQAFLSFLLQLLHHKMDPIVDPFRGQIDNLEKELRFLLTVFGDISWMMCDSFQNLLPEFEAVANQAGSFVHHLFFSADRAFEKTNEALSAVVASIDVLKANLKSYVSTPSALTTPTTSIINSILVFYTLVDDLEDLLKREDDSIPDVENQVNVLYQELLLSHSLIEDLGSPRLSEIGEVEEALMRIGGIAHQAEYLITSFLVNDAPLWYVFKRLTHLNVKIELIRMELQVITQKPQFRGLEMADYFSAESALHDKRNTEVNDVTVGLEDKTLEILYQLVGGATRSLQIVSILGMPGLGKTTLAKKLYNHPLVGERFDKLSWCVVSQTYKRQSVMANILIDINSKLGKDSILKMEEISLVEQIHKTLMGRRYLIVLDDLWDSSVLDELRECFPDDENGSRILVTSRNKDATLLNSMIHELPLLTDEQCWELLEKKVFGSRTCPSQLHGIGTEIAANCRGLPLTVVVIAGVLSTVDEEERAWIEVGESLASYTDDSVMQILELSYKHLPDRLKPCFLYFGEFEEDEEISVGNLKRLWVAEGFIRKEKGKSAENIAGEYLMELIDKSLVIIAKRRIDGKRAKSCVVHDLLRDLCLRISKEESFLEYVNNDHDKGANVDSATLRFPQHVHCFRQSDSFYVRDMRVLRVLYSTRIHRDQIFGIEYLVNLRFLVIYKLPTWIDRLVNLEYLRVKESVFICTYIPPTIVKMKKLRYLHALSVEYGEDWTTSCQTNNLECLSWVNIRMLKDKELLKCSPHLRKLKCHYYVDWKSECPHFDLRFLAQLHSLSLSGYLKRKDFGFPSSIKKLTLSGSSLPFEKMSTLGKLKFLEVLILSSDAFEGERWDTRDGEFQKLRFLKLDSFQFLSRWNVASYEHFPELERLILIECLSLHEIPSEIGEITTLELIEVRRCCLELMESAERIKDEQRDMGNEELRVIIAGW